MSLHDGNKYNTITATKEQLQEWMQDLERSNCHNIRIPYIDDLPLQFRGRTKRIGKIDVASNVYEEFWQHFGRYFTPYTISFDVVRGVFTITGCSPLFAELHEGEEIPFYNPGFKRVHDGVLVVDL
jgi:hypothetical protein